MQSKCLIIFSILLSGLVLGPGLVCGGGVIQGDRAGHFVLAKVGDNPRKVYPGLKSLASYLSSRLQDQGIRGSAVRIAPDNETMILWLTQGKVDMVTETPFSAVFIKERSRANVIALGWRKGVSSYHSVFFVRRDSGINTLEDLIGKIVAFEDTGSTSGYFLPAAELLLKGYDMGYMPSLRRRVAGHAVNYVFSGAEANSVTWVSKGLVHAAALSNLDWECEESVPKDVLPDLKIIHRTRAFPRSVELVNALRPVSFQRRLADELHRAHTFPEGVAAMNRYKQTTRFGKVDAAMCRSLELAGELLKTVQEKLE